MIPLRDENPPIRAALVTWSLILANLAVFIYMLTIKGSELDSFIYRFSSIPWEVTRGQRLPPNVLSQLLSGAAGLPQKNIYLSMITCMFLHSGWLHLAFNMLFLAIFGNNIEDAMGHFPFLCFYLISGVAATGLQTIVNPNSIAPMVGASGAISGVMGAYLVLYPRARILTLAFIFIVYIPAWAFIGVWIVYQLLSAAESISGVVSGVAWFAHLGGFASGALMSIAFYPVLKKRILTLPYIHRNQKDSGYISLH